MLDVFDYEFTVYFFYSRDWPAIMIMFLMDVCKACVLIYSMKVIVML